MKIASNSSPQQVGPPARLTDSPWFWLVLFANAALIGMTLIGPKYAQREAMLERRFEVRSEIARQKASGEQPRAEPSREGDPRAQDRPLRVSLGPLMAALAAIDLAAMTVLVWRQIRKPATGGEQHQGSQ